VAPTLVSGQSAITSIAESVTTFAVTLPGAATAGNLLVVGIGGDKDIGTLTLTGYTETVALRTSSVSLSLAWKTAAGGETTISGTISGANSGSSDMWAGEYEEAGSGAWELKASASSNDDGSNTLTKTTGTTGAATGDGLAIAAWSVDSQGSGFTQSYSNSFTERAAAAGGSTAGAGLWIAEKTIAASATTECTITRATGASADQMSGAVLVFGRAASGVDTVGRTRAMLGLL
jgi:hypothetical protein